MSADPESLGVDRHIPALARDWQTRSPDENYKILEGTLLFGDISGFTALAERLAQQGRQGGEAADTAKMGGLIIEAVRTSG